MALVLVIDDEAGIRDLVREVLEEAGHAVLEAEDGRAGLSIFRAARPDVAIVDLFMPEKEGIETIGAMRAASPEMTIVAISGGGRFGVTEVLDGVTALGATMALQKPFRPERLLSALEQAMTGVAKWEPLRVADRLRNRETRSRD